MKHKSHVGVVNLYGSFCVKYAAEEAAIKTIMSEPASVVI